MGARGHDQRRRECADDSDGGDRHDRAAESPPPDVHPAVEENDDQRDDADPLDSLDVGESDWRCEGCEQEEGRRGNREVRREPVHQQGEQDAGRDDENDQPEIEQLVHAADANGFLTTPSFRTQGEAPYFELPMRRLLVPCLLLALAIPAAAYTRTPPPGENGTLSIREGRGVLQLNARGNMSGRLNGRLTITDPKPYDAKRPVVYGATRTIYRNVKTTVFQGKNVRFRLIGAQFQIRLQGKAIFVSAIGRGKFLLDGAGDVAANIFYDGVWSLNDEPYKSLPDDPSSFELVASPTG